MRVDKRGKAEEMLRKGFLPAEIAKTLEVSDSTVRSWKRRMCNAKKSQRKSATQRKVETLLDISEENTELNDAQKAFCLYYSKTFNATTAYMKAYPDSSYISAGTSGSRLLQNDKIRNEVQRMKKARNLQIMATGEDVVEKMMNIAFADITDYLAWGSQTIATDEGEEVVSYSHAKKSTEVDGTLLSEVKHSRDGIQVKVADRMRALEWLGEYFELNPKDQHRKYFDNEKLKLQEKLVDIQANKAGIW